MVGQKDFCSHKNLEDFNLKFNNDLRNYFHTVVVSVSPFDDDVNVLFWVYGCNYKILAFSLSGDIFLSLVCFSMIGKVKILYGKNGVSKGQLIWAYFGHIILWVVGKTFG